MDQCTVEYGNARLLLVDDDPGILRLLARWLKKAGYPTQFATDGQDALVAIEQECPDLVITDWDMPRIDGLELCRRIRQMDLPHYVYIIFLSVKSGPEESVLALEVGADDFVAKPVREGELLARVRAGARMLALERRLSQLASTDPLTGLMTQRTFYECLGKEWQRCQRHHLPLSCVMLDLDFFKRINDTYGHPAGDAVLKVVAQTLAENCRRSDFLCRYGGEEFCALLPETAGEKAELWAERVRQCVAGLAIPVGGRLLKVTASFGVTQRHQDTHNPGELVDRADQALLCAKHSGRDRVTRFESLTDASESCPNRQDRESWTFRGVTARDVMTPLAAWLSEDQTVGQSVGLFLRSRNNAMPVVNAEGKLVGILSEKDVMAALASLDTWELRVCEVMKSNVITYEQQTPVHTIYEFLCRVSIRRVIITGDDGRPVGTISRSTLLSWFRNLVSAKVLSKESVASADFDRAQLRQDIAVRVGHLASKAAQLQEELQRDSLEPWPGVLGSITQLQQLMDGLLVRVEASCEPAAQDGAQAQGSRD